MESTKNVFACAIVLLAAGQMVDCEHQPAINLFKTVRHTPNPRGCIDYLLGGNFENGYYTLYDKQNKRYTAYCDFTSEPGSAWTLVVSFSRRTVLTEQSQVLRKKSLGENWPFNQDTPNWYGFRAGKNRMDAVKQVSSHFRMTCSANGPFTGIPHMNDYVRVSFSSLDPFTLNTYKCFDVEYISIRNISCYDCKAGFAQIKDLYTLHTDANISYNCGIAKAKEGAVPSEDNFGYYYHYNTKFTCTESDLSTTQIWFGARLHSGMITKN